MPKATSRPSHGSDVHGSRVRVGCLDFDSHSLDEAARYIIDLGHQRQPSIVVTPNTDILRLCTQDVSLRQIVDRAALVLPDGWPVVLASKLSAPTTLLGGSLSSRVPGSDLMWQVCAAADEHQLPVAIVG